MSPLSSLTAVSLTRDRLGPSGAVREDGPVNSLIRAAAETERHVAGAGWDQPVRLFALVPTAELMQAEPALAETLVPRGQVIADDALTAIEQDDLPRTDSIEELLGQIAWPEQVAGTAVAVERIVVPPEAEADLPDDPQEALAALADHPQRKDVRLLVAVARSGEHVCLLRQRDHDEDDAVATGPDIAPGLVAALRATLED